MTTDSEETKLPPGAAGSAEAQRRFGQAAQPGPTPIDLEPSDDGYDGLAAAHKRFTDIYPAQRSI